MMSKLDIKPFTIGFIPVAGFDNKTKIFYPEINLNPDKTLEDFKEAYGKALTFCSTNRIYYSRNNYFLNWKSWKTMTSS